MLNAAGRPMVVLAAQRAGTTGAEVVVATSDRPEDDVIARAVDDAGIRVVRGPLDDPLRRFAIATADLADDDVVVRLTADNVVPDGDLVSLLAAEVTGPAAYVRVGGDDPALPYGVAGEAFTVRALREADKEAVDPADREHVTPYVRRVHGDRRATVADVPDGWGALRCTVDTFDDYVALSRVLDGIGDPVGTGWREVCARLAELVRGETAAPRHGATTPSTRGRSCSAPSSWDWRTAPRTGPGCPTSRRPTRCSPRPRRPGSATWTRPAPTASPSDVSARPWHAGSPSTSAWSPRCARLTTCRPTRRTGWGEEAVAGLRPDQPAAARHRARSTPSCCTGPPTGAVPAYGTGLLRLRDDGHARLVGASLSSPAELLTLLDDREVGYVQLPFNLLDRRWLDDELTLAAGGAPRPGRHRRSAYLQGLLVDPDARWPLDAGVDQAEVTAAVASLVDELGRESAADLCLAWVLGHPWVTSVVVGAETAEQVRESARLTRNPPLSPEEIAHVADVLPAGGDDLVDPSRWRTS